MAYPNLFQLIILRFVETFPVLRKEHESDLLENKMVRKISECSREEK
jgi:hypothetical protein